MKGYVHSLESFGTVDGPGIRLVVFLQGCPLRCLYCHNPDTWTMKGGQELDSDEILKTYDNNKSFYTKGGITVTGGEPLRQIDFLIELFSKAKRENIHTCIDTSGIYFSRSPEILDKYKILMAVTDLVLMDIKHINPRIHLELTGQPNHAPLAFLNFLNEVGAAVWIRQVLVPGYTDDPADLYETGQVIGQLSCVKAVDILPYHAMGLAKYQAMNIDYPLIDVKEPSDSDIKKAREYVLKGICK